MEVPLLEWLRAADERWAMARAEVESAWAWAEAEKRARWGLEHDGEDAAWERILELEIAALMEEQEREEVGEMLRRDNAQWELEQSLQ